MRCRAAIFAPETQVKKHTRSKENANGSVRVVDPHNQSRRERGRSSEYQAVSKSTPREKSVDRFEPTNRQLGVCVRARVRVCVLSVDHEGISAHACRALVLRRRRPGPHHRFFNALPNVNRLRRACDKAVTGGLFADTHYRKSAKSSHRTPRDRHSKLEVSVIQRVSVAKSVTMEKNLVDKKDVRKRTSHFLVLAPSSSLRRTSSTHHSSDIQGPTLPVRYSSACPHRTALHHTPLSSPHRAPTS